MEKCAMTPPRRPVHVMAVAALLISALMAVPPHLPRHHGRAFKDASGAVLAGRDGGSGEPRADRKGPNGGHRWHGTIHDHQPAPGTYSVAFTLPGFSTVKREAIEVSANFTSRVNAEMRVGAVEETITVTGETPIVDVQSAATTPAGDRRGVSSNIPTSGVWIQLAALIPAMQTSNARRRRRAG